MSPRNLFFFPKAPWTLIHLLELPKTEHRQFQVLVIMWNNRNSHSLLAGIQNDTAIWKTVQWFLTILNRILPHDLAIALLVFTQKKLKTRPFKNLHMDIYSSFFFHSCENLVHTGNGILYSTKKQTEKAMAPHSSTLAWKIPWMEEPGRLQSMG